MKSPPTRWAFLFALSVTIESEPLWPSVNSTTTLARLDYRRAGQFTVLLLLINLASDGFSGRPVGIVHQLLILPLTLAFLAVFLRFGQYGDAKQGGERSLWTPTRAVVLAVVLQCTSVAAYFYEARHFAALGYRPLSTVAAAVFPSAIAGLAYFGLRRPISAVRLLVAAVGCYVVAMILAIASFPLTYLRSDMLPVILWADTNLLHHVSPYKTMYMGGRVYDFPYLPGMIVSYLPAVALHMDLRWVGTLCIVAAAVLIFTAARTDRRLEVAALLAIFLTCPYLQYRHEIYSQPHWLTLVVVFVLMQRRRFVLAAVVFGVSMSIYQFSWIIFPFFLLNAWRRRGWLEVAKLAAAAAAGALAIVGPFLSTAYARIASNTVGQWGLRAHADANPINLSYWVTYVVPPSGLLRLQAAVLVAVFAYCFFKRRCETLADTLRWMVISLTIFIMLNVLVDGYFYLMLLVPMLVYTCVANGWWKEFGEEPALAG